MLNVVLMKSVAYRNLKGFEQDHIEACKYQKSQSLDQEVAFEDLMQPS